MFHFTIRDLLWLTVVVALSVGWFTSANTIRKLTEQNHSLQADVKLANEQSDKAWAALNDPFYRANPLDDAFRSKRMRPVRPN
jgi:hypothetical protein